VRLRRDIEFVLAGSVGKSCLLIVRCVGQVEEDELMPKTRPKVLGDKCAVW